MCSLSIRFISEPEVLSNFLGLITSHTLVCDASDVFSYLLRFTFDLDVCICGFQGTSSFLAGFISHQNLRTSFLTSDHWSNQLYQQRFPAVSGWHASVGARSIFISTFPCFLFGRWQPPALPHRLQCSTIGGAGSHLLSHTVSSAVPSAALVLTIVFGMGTGVSPKRIATSSSYPVFETAKSIPFRYSLITKQQNTSFTCSSLERR